MNILKRELRANRTVLIIWSVCMFLSVLSGMGKYTAYSSGGQAMNNMLAKMPYSVKVLLGFNSFDMSTISGYFALLFLYIEIVAAIHAVLLGSGILSKEERDKTTEFLMAKPVSRASIISGKLLAAFLNVLVLNLVTLVSSVALVAAYNKGKDISGEIAVFMLSLFLVQLIFMTLGTALAAVLRNAKAAGGIATGILLGSFILSKITDLNQSLTFLNILSPFKYFSYNDIVNGRGLSGVIVALSLLLVAGLTGVTYVFYQKRDLSV